MGLVLGTGEMQCGHPRLCLPGAQLFNCTRCLHLASTVDMHDVLVIKCFIPGHIGMFGIDRTGFESNLDTYWLCGI